MGAARVIGKFWRSPLGVVAVWFGLSVPMVVSAVGVSVDLGQTYLVKERLSHALDAAALAAAANASEDQHVIEERVNDFIGANYPPEKIGHTVDVKVENTPKTLYVSATARLDTAFMKVVGIETVDVFAETEVTKEVKAIEVVLVMDVTGSMATKTNGVTRIDSLKSAAKLFTKTMFERVKSRNHIKIGLVPFSATVNVGRYGLGRTPSNGTYDSGFMSNPLGLQYFDPQSKSNPSTTERKRWWGCVLETPPDDTVDHDGPWKMYRYCRNTSDTVRCDSSNANNDANIGCPTTVVTPMTNNQSTLDGSIDQLEAEGNTYINVGLVWGERMISPEFPFREGVSWTNPDWKKAIILMTDGVNEPNINYSAYGISKDRNRDGSIDSNENRLTVSQINENATALNNKMLKVCNDLRAKDVLVYTITFDKGVSSSTKNLFKQCATVPSMWYDAPDGNKLREVYLTIAKELANLHLSK